MNTSSYVPVLFEFNEASACKVWSQFEFRIGPKLAESQYFVGIILSMVSFCYELQSLIFFRNKTILFIYYISLVNK